MAYADDSATISINAAERKIGINAHALTISAAEHLAVTYRVSGTAR